MYPSSTYDKPYGIGGGIASWDDDSRGLRKKKSLVARLAPHTGKAAAVIILCLLAAVWHLHSHRSKLVKDVRQHTESKSRMMQQVSRLDENLRAKTRELTEAHRQFSSTGSKVSQLETKLRDKETARLETNQLLQVEKQRSAGLVADVERLRQQLQAAQQQLQAGQQQHANELAIRDSRITVLEQQLAAGARKEVPAQQIPLPTPTSPPLPQQQQQPQQQQPVPQEVPVAGAAQETPQDQAIPQPHAQAVPEDDTHVHAGHVEKAAVQEQQPVPDGGRRLGSRKYRHMEAPPVADETQQQAQQAADPQHPGAPSGRRRPKRHGLSMLEEHLGYEHHDEMDDPNYLRA